MIITPCRFLVHLFSILSILGTHSLFAELTIGQAAPDFTLTDYQGKAHTLNSYKGKIMVLEWVNFDCPFVRKHYDAGHMQKLQDIYTHKGIVWLAVNSSAPGKQGNFDNAALAQKITEQRMAATTYLIDADGAVGHSYDAKTTPHVFIIDKQGNLAYQGAIDDDPGVWGSNPADATNHVRIALDELLAGKSVSTPQTKAYGCSVKY